MCPEDTQGMSFEDYKNMEIALHRDLMNSCRKYVNDLSIVSILGILDVVKQEAIELEKAKNRNIPYEHTEEAENPFSENIQ